VRPGRVGPAAAAALAAGALALSAGAPARGAGSAGKDVDPIRVDVAAPHIAAAHARVLVAVVVHAHSGALTPVAGALRVRVRLAAGECGGSYAGTPGRRVLEAVLARRTNRAVTARFAARIRLGGRGVRTICVFLEDRQQRQFATDVESTFAVRAARSRHGAR
jgi:hypothetical protein